MKLLEREISIWIDGDATRLVRGFDPESEEQIQRVFVTEETPVRFGLILGDVFQNLRNALDNLAFALAESYTGTPLPDAVAEDSAFPILKRPPPYTTAVKKTIDLRLSGIDPRAKAAIIEMQPLNASNPMQHFYEPLWLLHRLANEDKHRLLHFPVSSNRGVRASSASLSYVYQVVEGPVEDGDVVLRYKRRPDTPEAPFDVVPLLSLAFPAGSTAAGLDVIGTLERIWNSIGHWVLPGLQEFLIDPS